MSAGVAARHCWSTHFASRRVFAWLLREPTWEPTDSTDVGQLWRTASGFDRLRSSSRDWGSKNLRDLLRSPLTGEQIDVSTADVDAAVKDASSQVS